MLVSALLTSVGINSFFCIIFFFLYSILRKQPSYADVYIPRLISDGSPIGGERSNLNRLIPSAGWFINAWRLSESDILSNSGLDALVFTRIITFSVKVFTFAGAVGMFVLLPINCSGTALIDFEAFTNSSLDVFTISNVSQGSNWLWAHFAAVYALTIFVCCLLYYEYDYISTKRLEQFRSSRPMPHQFTILVHAVPLADGERVTDTVQSFFTKLHPSTYLSHVVIRRTNKLRSLIRIANTLYNRISWLKSQSPHKHNKVKLEDYGKKLEDVEEVMRLEQAGTSETKDTRAAFVSFKTRYAAATAVHMRQSDDPTKWITQHAPEPSDVYWPFFSSSFMRRWISRLVVIVTCVVLTVLFLIPVVVVQGLTNLDQLEILFPFLSSLLSKKLISEVVTGYLPSLILQLFLKIVPPIMFFLSSIQGHVSISEIERSACAKVLWFTVWNVFVATVFSGSFFYQLSVFLDPENIPTKLAVSVPAQASFFIAYVVTNGWTSTCSELFQVIPFLWNVVSRCCCCCDRRRIADVDFEAPALPYHREVPRLLFFSLLGITYFFLAPLILPFLLVYLCLAYVVFRNELVHVYVPRYETGGKMWPLVHNLTVFSLVLMHCIAVGIFTLKKVPYASTLMFPLLALTLLFNEYCRKRFLPNFSSYSAEVVLKKDKEDEKDPMMGAFFDNLVTAYKDPALVPREYSSCSDHAGSPLLSV